jgi:formate hydrogenlyase subunit 3/multisubunit Na+/H+ antiporter MnhD subunit
MLSEKIIFSIPILAVGGAAAVHATAYIHGEEKRHLPRFWFFFLATLASMTAVVFADGKLPFLLAWEAMGLASAGLVAFESKEKSVRKATWIYLLACHAGACALMMAGVFLNRPDAAVAAFACAVAGFGLKIGFPPFHSWLPEAHPAAPAPASAIMSGAMIPLGFCGFFKFFQLCPGMMPDNAALCGWTFLALGVIGSVGGILFALPQANLKRLLAFSSVENMGVVAMGLGLSFLITGQKADEPLAMLCLGGALAHILNHALLKGSLFLAAGSVLRQTGTLDQDRLGGLMRRMPFTGALFAVNAFGLAGLPPLSGFLGELAIYIAAFSAIKTGDPVLVAAGFLVAVALSVTGGLAVAAYAKAIGGAFLGEPRSQAAENAAETPSRMWAAQLFLTCLGVAMIPGTVFLVHKTTGGFATDILLAAAVLGLAFAAVTVSLLLIRRFACPRGAEKPRLPVWDCGYDRPTTRMAYTATAFTQPLVDLCRPLLRTRRHVIAFKGDPASPSDAAIATETDDLALGGLWRPVFTQAARLFQRAHLLQNGSLHLYILIILIAVLALLVAALVS